MLVQEAAKGPLRWSFKSIRCSGKRFGTGMAFS